MISRALSSVSKCTFITPLYTSSDNVPGVKVIEFPSITWSIGWEDLDSHSITQGLIGSLGFNTILATVRLDRTISRTSQIQYSINLRLKCHTNSSSSKYFIRCINQRHSKHDPIPSMSKGGLYKPDHNSHDAAKHTSSANMRCSGACLRYLKITTEPFTDNK